MVNRIRKILLKDYIYYLLVSFTLIFTLLYTNLYNIPSKYNGNEPKFVGTIINTNIDGNKLSITIKAKEKLIGNYYIYNLKEKEYLEQNLKLGDTVSIKGILEKPSNNTVPNSFNYKEYLYNNNIFWIINIDNINKLKN